MKLQLIILLSAICFAFPRQSNAQTKNPVSNYLGIKSPLILQNISYKLVWSAHPDASLFKQEYLPADDTFPKYKSMITVDFVVSEASIDQAVKRKVDELRQLKISNPNVFYEIIGNKAKNEIIIDCLISLAAGNENESLVEHDIFRFKSVKATSGQQGILLFALSTRRYGKEIQPFLLKLKCDRKVMIKNISEFPLPKISLTRSRYRSKSCLNLSVNRPAIT